MNNSNIEEIKINNSEQEYEENKLNDNSMSTPKTDDSIQDNRSGEKFAQIKAKMPAINEEESWIKEENITAPLTNTKDIVIDIEDRLSHNANNTKIRSVHYQNMLFKKYLRRGENRKERRNVTPQKCVYNQRNMNLWVQYSFGHGRGSGKGAGSGKDDSDRNSFVFLVMVIVAVMLLITAGWIIVVMQTKLYDVFHKPSLISVISATIGMTLVYYGMMCVPPLQKPPCVFIMLILTVFFMCWIAAIVTCKFETIIVFYAVIVTLAIVFACALLACTPFDFTSFWLYLVVFSVAFSVVAMCILIGMKLTGNYMKPLHIAILIISVCLQSMALVMELQMIAGGKSIEMDESQYGLAAYMLYTSIVQIFLNLVQILGLLDNN